MQNNRRWHPDKYRHAVDCSYTPSLSTNIYTGLIIKAIKQKKPKLKFDICVAHYLVFSKWIGPPSTVSHYLYRDTCTRNIDIYTIQHWQIQALTFSIQWFHYEISTKIQNQSTDSESTLHKDF